MKTPTAGILTGGIDISMLDFLKPYARAYKYRRLFGQAKKIAMQAPTSGEPTLPKMAFVVACGRSGTTVLGKVMAVHPSVCYLFEPYHLWAAAEPVTDVLNLYHDIDPKLLLDAPDCTDQARLRFTRQIDHHWRQRKTPLVIEKTPLNAMRIGYLDALAPGAVVAHILRDGVDVAQSIAKIASHSGYKMAGKATLNQWWGVGGVKWRTLARDGAAAGYFPDEVGLLKTEQAKGAYEWLVSLGEIDRHREMLGDRLYEIDYTGLTADPKGVLTGLCERLGVDTPTDWLNEAIGMFRPARGHGQDQITLPPKMCQAFNDYQERFGYTKRAVTP
jgi:Sulfotransferase family